MTFAQPSLRITTRHGMRKVLALQDCGVPELLCGSLASYLGVVS
jgi:hypothetical protein